MTCQVEQLTIGAVGTCGSTGHEPRAAAVKKGEGGIEQLNELI